MIVAGNGSDELLAMLFRAALSRGDKVAWATPTYSLYDTLGGNSGGPGDRGSVSAGLSDCRSRRWSARAPA